MISKYFEGPEVVQRFRTGCMGPWIDGFAEMLSESGFTYHTIRGHLRAAVHLGRWMDDRKIVLASLDNDVASCFRRHLPRCRCNVRSKGFFRRTMPAIDILLAHLRRLGVIQGNALVADRPQFTEVSAHFAAWSVRNRGIKESTARGYQVALQPFLSELGEDHSTYNAARIRSFVVKHLCTRGRSEAKSVTRSIRAFLRFLVAEGRVTAGLEHCVPTVPQWRLSSLPRYLVASDVEKVLAACDTTTPHGLRDRAILLLLARLGLRANDIVTMDLDHIDWTGGTLRVSGKSRKESFLPLPQDVGDAILAYLERGRSPACSDRVFLAMNAPIRPFTNSSAVSSVVSLALKRAGIENPPSRGAHMLRHSAATAMLRAGSPLETIASVLRHKSPDMAAYYAKIDVGTLGLVVQPWAGGAP